MIAVSIMIMFFAGICTYIHALVDDLALTITRMDAIAKEITALKTNAKHLKSELKCLTNEMIAFHANILE